MRLFRRRKPLHERLLEAGGLGVPEAHSDDRLVVGGSRETGIHGIARQRVWDTVGTVELPGVEGDTLEFDVLPDRTILVEREDGDASLAPLADTVERDLEPPYRARAVRQRGDLWAVAARRIQVVRLAPRDGGSIQITVRDGARELAVDGEPEFGSVPELERLVEGRHDDVVVRAERLDEDWWEVRVDPL